MKEEYSIIDILDMMIRHWWILLVTAIVFGTVGFVYFEVFVDPLYTTDGTLYVNAQRDHSVNVTTGTMSASQELVLTYKEILTRRTFLSGIAAELDNRYSVSELKNMISLKSVNETEVMEISVTGKVPEDVHTICNLVLTKASDELVRVINAGSVKILDMGYVPTTPSSPNVRGNTLLVSLVGIIFGALIILMLELFDTRVKSREDIINKYEEPLLGEIPILIPVGNEGEGEKR